MAFEYVRLEVRADGIFYLASPSGGPSTGFEYAGPLEGHPQGAVFFNPDHDFPRRITYWREGDQLFARIDAGEPGEGPHEDAVTWTWEAAEPALR